MTNPSIIEPRDIARILANGDAVTLPDGTRALSVLLVLHPDSAAQLPPERIRLGAIEQTYVLEPQPAPVSAPAQLVSKPAKPTEDA